MRRRIAGLALLASATALAAGAAAPAAGAEATPKLVVAKAIPFPVAAAGGNAYLRVVVTNFGDAPSPAGRVRVAVVRPGRKPLPLKVTGADFPARDPGKSRTVLATARLPAAVAAGTRVRLRVCARTRCAGAGEVILAGPTSLQLIDTAESTGALFAGPAALARMRDAWSDPNLRRELRAGGRSPDDHAAVVEAAAAFPLLSQADQAQLLPYFLPKVVRDSLPVPARAAVAADPCVAIAQVWKQKLAGLHALAAAGGKVRVWYPVGHAAGARRYANAFDDAWPKLTQVLGAPRVARGGCLPVNGRLNVFLEPATGYAKPAAAVTVPVPVRERGAWKVRCTRTPTFIAIEDGAPRSVVPHELMHAIQFSYKYVSCRDLIPLQNRWWDEGSATWASDFVYPHDNWEHRYDRAFTATTPVWAESYAAWPFWWFLTKANGPAVMRDVLERLDTAPVRAAVDAEIPGGYAEQFPAYLRWLRNASPVGEPGFPVQRSFAGLDALSLKPRVDVDRTLSLAGAPERTFVARVIDPADAHYCSPSDVIGAFTATCEAVDGHLAPQMRVYQHFTIADPSLRELRFENGIAGKPGEHVEAWLKLADGTWRTADWSADSTALCRDLPAQDVSELWVVETNVGTGGDGFPALALRNRLRGSDHCSLTSFAGEFAGTTQVVADAQDTTTGFHGTLRLDPADSETDWRIGPSSLSVDSMSGTLDGCAASVDPTSFTMPTLAQTGSVMQLSDGAYSLLAGAPPDSELSVHLTGADPGCSDGTFALTRFIQDIARSEAPVAPGPDGTITGSATLSPADGVTEQLTWSLAPVP